MAALLGSALNDSGAIVGGVASMVLAASLVVLLMDLDPPAGAAEGSDPRGGEADGVGCDPVVITAETPPTVPPRAEIDGGEAAR